jgi:hypothetical protein
MERNGTSYKTVDQLFKNNEAILPATSITEALLTLLSRNQQFWVRLEVKVDNEIDPYLLPPNIGDRALDSTAPIALFVYGSTGSAVFFHELKEYADNFYLMETETSGAAALTLVLFFV